MKKETRAIIEWNANIDPPFRRYVLYISSRKYRLFQRVSSHKSEIIDNQRVVVVLRDIKVTKNWQPILYNALEANFDARRTFLSRY